MSRSDNDSDKSLVFLSDNDQVVYPSADEDEEARDHLIQPDGPVALEWQATTEEPPDHWDDLALPFGSNNSARHTQSFESDPQGRVIHRPTEEHATLRDVWELFFGEILGVLAARSNGYLAHLRAGSAPSYWREDRPWPPKYLSPTACPNTTEDEIRRFIGLKILLGLMPPRERRWYWSKRAHPLIAPGAASAILSRKRFEQIEFFLHAADSARADGYAADNKIGKVHDVLELFRKRCSAVRLPGTCTCSVPPVPEAALVRCFYAVAPDPFMPFSLLVAIVMQECGCRWMSKSFVANSGTCQEECASIDYRNPSQWA